MSIQQNSGRNYFPIRSTVRATYWWQDKLHIDTLSESATCSPDNRTMEDAINYAFDTLIQGEICGRKPYSSNISILNLHNTVIISVGCRVETANISMTVTIEKKGDSN